MNPKKNGHILPLLLMIFTALAGCVGYSPSIPDGYTGPKATLRDTVVGEGTGKANFFFAAKLNDKNIVNSSMETARATYGKGFNLVSVEVERELPAESEITVRVVGQTQFAAPIQAAVNRAYRIEGGIRFTPEADTIYAVKGALGKDYCGVWIEDITNGRIVEGKIETGIPPVPDISAK